MVSPPKSKRSRQKKAKEKLVGVSKKPRRLFTYKEEHLMKAIDDIKNNKMGLREACRFYGLPTTTVHDRLSGKVAAGKKPKVGPDPVLGLEGEQKLTKWILNMSKCGFPLSKQDLLENISKIIKKTGIKTPFKDGKPGETWYQGFMKRHPEISMREPEGINNARAAVSETRIRSWFRELKDYIESIDALDIFEDPNRIFNGDETGFCLCPKSGKILAPRGYKNPYIIKKNNEKENITVLVVFTASGKLCPPLVIFPYVRPPRAVINNMPDSWVLGRSESGWMRTDVFYEYVCNEFNAWINKHDITKPVILFIDGHKSHMSFALSEFCEANGIILYALPANTTHILQPADVSVFRPLKQNWKNTVKNWQARTENINQTVTKLNFCSVLNETLTQTDLDDIIRNGFRKCGLYPLNEENVDYTKCVKDTQQRVRTSSSNRKSTVNAKDFDGATKIISLIQTNLARRNIQLEPILEEIEIARAKFLVNRRSKSKTPRNSAVSNQSNSILTEELGLTSLTNLAVTPENLTFDEPEIDMPQDAHKSSQNIEIITPCVPQSSQNIEILTSDAPQSNENIEILSSEVITDALFTADESTIKDISFPGPGSYISLNNISVMPFEEIEIAENQNASVFTVLAEVHSQPLSSFDDVFERHLQYPDPPTPKGKKNNGPKLPSAISSKAWREHYKVKAEEKENQDAEKKRKKKLRAEEKDKKAREKANKKRGKKTVPKNTPQKTVLQCSQCSEDLISDVEDDLEKNIGCDECIRWFHFKCTALQKPYAEAASLHYTCSFCEN